MIQWNKYIKKSFEYLKYQNIKISEMSCEIAQNVEIPKSKFKTVLKKKSKSDFQPDVLHALSIILLDSSKRTLPVGSAIYFVHKYPSDLDIMEVVKKCCTWNSVRLYVSIVYLPTSRPVWTRDLTFMSER